MRAFTTHTGLAAVLDRDDVDTDQVIPKQFLKRITRTGYDDALFFDWRFLSDGSLNPDFELNHPSYEGASILIAGATSAAARRASTPPGRSTTTASASSSPPASPTSSATTASRTACSPSPSTRPPSAA